MCNEPHYVLAKLLVLRADIGENNTTRFAAMFVYCIALNWKQPS